MHAVHVPVLVVTSLSDEYVPPGCDAARLAHRLLGALGRLAPSPSVPSLADSLRRSVVIGGADHALSDPVAADVFLAEVALFLECVSM